MCAFRHLCSSSYLMFWAAIPPPIPPTTQLCIPFRSSSSPYVHLRPSAHPLHLHYVYLRIDLLSITSICLSQHPSIVMRNFVVPLSTFPDSSFAFRSEPCTSSKHPMQSPCCSESFFPLCFASVDQVHLVCVCHEPPVACFTDLMDESCRTWKERTPRRRHEW